VKWRCTWCDEPHETNDPPCDVCGHNSFRRAEDELETVDTGTQYVWVCADCGREHVKNSPPCSRCNSPTLEKHEPDYRDVDADLEVPSYVSLAKPYVPAVAVIGLVIALFATGIIPASILPGVGAPAPPDAPGEGAEAAGLDLFAVESEVHDRLEAERESAGEASRTYDDGLAGLAEYRTHQRVAAADAGVEPDEWPNPADFDTTCEGDIEPVEIDGIGESIDAFEDESALATAIVDILIAESQSAALEGWTAEGLDVHVYDGTVFVVYLAC